MSKKEIKAPSVGESITEVRIAKWLKQNGEAVKNGDLILEIESDKATVEVAAEASGALSIDRNVGDTVKIGEVLGYIDEAATGVTTSKAVEKPTTPATPTAAAKPHVSVVTSGGMAAATLGQLDPGPAVRKIAAEQNINLSTVPGTGKDGRVTKADIVGKPLPATTSVPAPQKSVATDGRERRVPMTLLRQKIAERLVHAQHTAAILTTFNESDMKNVMEIRSKHKESFKAKNGVPLSFMSFFARAVVEALKAVPAVNAMIDGKDMIFRDYYDVGVAVGTDRGLVVPVIRDAGALDFVGFEKALGDIAARARVGKLSIQELTGGTFTISNGGTYGSLLSTPILNPPQSGILGMHKIQERPMAVNGQVVVRPMMYLALSYDHRIIDGKEAVTFLIKVKEGIENPALLGWKD